MDDNLYSTFAKYMGQVVAGKLPEFTTLVVYHDDGCGTMVFPTHYEAFEAAHKKIDEIAAGDPFSYPAEDIKDLKRQLDEVGHVHLEDIAGTKLYVITGKLGQMEMLP